MHNEITVIGRLSDNSEFRTTTSGHRVANLSIATNDSYKNKQGDYVDTVDWHRLQIWRKAAEFAERNLGKGDLILAIGKLKYNNYEKDGQKHTVAYIEVKTLKVVAYKNADKAATPINQEHVSEIPEGAATADDLPF